MEITLTRREHVLRYPTLNIGITKQRQTQKLWLYENDKLVYRSISYLPGLRRIFDEVLINAADNKQRGSSMDSLEVTIDPETNTVSVYNNGYGVPVKVVHVKKQRKDGYLPELVFSDLSFYDKVHCDRLGTGGSRLTNIFSTEFVIETADGSNKYKQVFKNNMDTISVPEVTDCKADEKWTKVTFKPDLAQFKMGRLEEDIVGLMKKRVLDMALCLGKNVNVKLNGQLIHIIKSCDDLDSRPVNAIELPFRKKKALDKKTWIRKFKPIRLEEYPDKLIYFRYIFDKELKLFSRANLQSSIPSMVDGLKRGQRKVLFCSLKKKLCNPIKVDKFIGYVSKHSAYHHCQKSIASTIIGMAQDFVGSNNNINLLKPIGIFGSRYLGGKNHASTRDIYTELNPVTRYLFHAIDDKLLEYLTEDVRSIEPNWYIPIIPLVLVNGSSENIGTGWTSYIANYNPKMIIANVKRWLNGEDMVPMKPWYRGFNGKIEKSDKKGVYEVSGTWDYIKDDRTLIIGELPIRMWTQDYIKYLGSITKGSPNEKFDLLEDVTHYGYCHPGVNFEIRIKSDREDMIMELMKHGGGRLEKRFKLTTTISTNNMYLLDAEGKIKKFESPEQILKEFIPLRLKYYEKRKEYILANLERLLCLLFKKLKLIPQLLLIELNRERFTPMPRNGKSTSTEPQVAGENGDNSEALEGDYEYLLSLSVKTLFFKSAWKELLAKMKGMKKQFDVLKATPPSSLWMDDLNELGKKLDVVEKYFNS